MNLPSLKLHIILLSLIIALASSAQTPLTDPSQLAAAGTYIVDSDITLRSNVTIAPGVTLIFSGGRITADSPVTLTATSTAMLAPDAPVFGKNISADGLWNITYASPLWFEPETTAGSKDYAKPISKAAAMIGKGIVQLPAGHFFVGSPILLPAGVTLKGSSGESSRKTKDQTPATHISPIPSSPAWIKSATDTKGSPFLIYINADPATRKITNPFPTQWVAISHMRIANSPSLSFLRGIYAAGGIGFDTVVWSSFGQAVTYSLDYNDNKSIINCQYNNDYTTPWADSKEYERLKYAIDFGSLGDALQVRHCHFSSAGHPMLYISQCGSGEISDNIINGDVSINYSKALRFTANHMEAGATISVSSSAMTIADNYFEKGARPSVTICSESRDNSVVTLCNNQYIFYSRDRSKAEESDRTIKQKRIEAISECDVMIDKYSFVDIRSEYRYNMVVGFGSIYPAGIFVTTPDGPLDAFNNKSYIYSAQSSISPGFNIHGSISLNNLNTTRIYNLQPIGWVQWFRPTGTYTYSFQLIPDIDRQIYETYKGNITTKANPQSGISLTRNGNGVLIGIAPESGSSSSMLRLYRSRVGAPGSLEYVDIPYIGTHILYDNGVSICGYKWRKAASITEPDRKLHYRAVSFSDGTAAAWTDGIPQSSSAWRPGDIIYNTGSDPSWQLHIVR